MQQVYGPGFATTLLTVILPVVAVLCVACGRVAWRHLSGRAG